MRIDSRVSRQSKSGDAATGEHPSEFFPFREAGKETGEFNVVQQRDHRG
jgi:hypothetical protein